MCKSESSQSRESRNQSTDSLKACSKPTAFNWRWVDSVHKISHDRSSTRSVAKIMITISIV